MFKTILLTLLKKRMLTKTQLAQEVGVSVGVLEDMITLMTNTGYLRTDIPDTCEPSACGGCAHSSSCSTDAPSVVYYTVTPKGTEYAKTVN